MLPALPSIDRRALFALLADSIPGITIVTANRRLAQALARAYDAERVAGGERAWQTPDIIPFAAWVERFWADAMCSELAAGLPLALSEAQEHAIWQQCIRDAGHDVLLSLPAAADQAMQAWSLAHAWGLARRLGPAAESVDARAFVEWSTRYERLTRERGHTDRARLPDQVSALLDEAAFKKPARIVLAGFDGFTPQQEALLQRLAEGGSSLEALGATRRNAMTCRASFPKAADELVCAARWARARLEADCAARIGIVVPDLSHARARVQRIFSDVLHPGRAAGDEAPAAFNISLGLPLDEWPIAHEALSVLRLCGRDLDFEAASRVLRSPFLEGAESEHAARQTLDATLRRRSPARVSIDRLARLAARSGMPSAPRLCAILDRLADYRRSDLFARRGAAEWARAMEAALRHAGFPGERTLDSAEYQTWMKWHEALATFASLEHVVGAMGYPEACERLARIAGSMLFQPETPDVPIQVLGVLESAGLEFDALWVTGLAEDEWPMPPRPNAFVPLALQRAAGVPRADASSSLALDERITAAWQSSASEVVFSHSRMRDDTEIAASPLVAHVAESPIAELAASDAPTLRQALRGAGKLQRIADGRGPAIRMATRPGGTRLFRDQAACPFRGFAHHRLGSAPVERPEPGLDAAARGTLMHEMLARVWKRIGTKARLDALSRAELDNLLLASANEAISACSRTVGDALVGRFEPIERERLVRTAREWLEKERAREPFEVVAIEEKREMTFGAVTVSVKLDRMDELSQGGRAVIDYKTGAAAVSSWLGTRPDEPQLPMYAVGSGEDVRAVVFARLKRGEMAFCGFSMEERLLPGKGVGLVEKNRANKDEYRNWAEMVAGWRGRLEAIGGEFARGEARVDPKSPAACEQCDQHLLCRIAEKRPQPADLVPKPGRAERE